MIGVALLCVGAAVCALLVGVAWLRAERDGAYARQALDDVLRWQRARREQWHPDRARLHYGVPCADDGCDCRGVAS